MATKYDVCLSFAGPDRPYVAQVAQFLTERGIRVFYDEYERADLWGKNLYDHLSEVYAASARYCVMFISKAYASRLWTNHERRSAQARAFKANSEYILPARFDDTEIPGVPETLGYQDLRTTRPAELAALIEEKLRSRTRSRLNVIDASQGIYPFGSQRRDSSYGSHDFREFQGVLVWQGKRPPDFKLVTLDRILTQIVALARKSDGTWTHATQEEFNIIYATSSVLTFLFQIGGNPLAPLIKRPLNYLRRQASRASIDDRAAVIAVSTLVGLDDDVLRKFLRNLRAKQIRKSGSINFGSFLLEQEAAGPLQKATTLNWDEAKYHKDGASFHACHLGDFISHLVIESPPTKALATELLRGMAVFFERAFDAHGGFLIDRSGQNSAITLFGYAVAHRLGIPLPRNWKRNVATIVTQLQASANLFFRCLGVMNLYYIYYSTRDEDFRSIYAGIVDEELRFLCSRFGYLNSSPRDLSVLGRAVVYGASLGATSWPVSAHRYLAQKHAI